MMTTRLTLVAACLLVAGCTDPDVQGSFACRSNDDCSAPNICIQCEGGAALCALPGTEAQACGPSQPEPEPEAEPDADVGVEVDVPGPDGEPQPEAEPEAEPEPEAEAEAGPEPELEPGPEAEPAPDAAVDADVDVDVEEATPPTPLEGRIKDFAGGESHSCLLDEDGCVYCWGLDSDAQGVHPAFRGTAPSAAVDGLCDADVVELAGGRQFSCGRTDTGKIWCWGDNESGQLGQASGGSFWMPQEVPLPFPAVGMSLSPYGGCAWGAAGEHRCWGADVGEGTPAVLPGAPLIRGAIRGFYEECVVTLELGEVLCRDAQSEEVFEPVGIGGGATLAGIERVVGDLDDFAGIHADGQVWFWDSWGDAAPVTLDDGTPLQGVAQLSAGINHICAAGWGGEVWCGGDNTWGQLGDGTTASTSTSQATAVLGLSPAASLGSGQYHNCVGTTEDTLLCWGLDLHGVLGDGVPGLEIIEAPTPVPVEDPVDWVQAAANHTFARTTTGALLAWGENPSLVMTEGFEPVEPLPVLIDTGLTSVEQVAHGPCHVCARGEGSVHCWGNDEFGQAGDSGPGYVYQPALLPLTGATGVAVDRCSTWVLKDDGQLFELGPGTVLPTPVNGIQGSIVALHGGYGATCFQTDNAGVIELWCVGSFDEALSGPCYQDVCADPGEPWRLEGFDNAVDPVVTAHGLCAILAGEVQCYDGASGVSQGVSLTGSPIALEGALDVVCARLASGGWVCWGSNAYGKLTLGEATVASVPTLIPAFEDLESITFGWFHGCGLAGDAVHCWGRDLVGQLGGGQLVGLSPNEVPLP